MLTLVSGATGFVGRALVGRLLAEGWRVRAALRDPSRGRGLDGMVELAEVGEIGPDTRWAGALSGVDVVFHLAARVHQLPDPSPDPASAYRRVNAAGTERLARAAAAAGVRRLVFVSSIKVNGEARAAPYTEDDAPAPADAYGESKREAEAALWSEARASGLEIVVVRPPLVYGPGVKANLLRLLRAVDRGLPLPLGAIRNRRSLLYVENLADALIACARDPRAAGRTYLVSDGEDLSTPGLIRALAKALARPARLVPVPVPLLRAAGTLLGARAAVDRLVGSLAVDSTRLRRELGWSPPFTTREGLERTAAWYRALSAPASATRSRR
jgi:nucleoside-diphosphate-sugar epimerase